MGGGGVKEIGWPKVNLPVVMVVVKQQHYITMNEIGFAKIFGATCQLKLSQINKVVILPQPFNQHAISNTYVKGNL